MANAHFASRLRNAFNSVWLGQEQMTATEFCRESSQLCLSHDKYENSAAATVLTTAAIPSADCGGTFQFTENCVTPASQLRFVRV